MGPIIGGVAFKLLVLQAYVDWINVRNKDSAPLSLFYQSGMVWRIGFKLLGQKAEPDMKPFLRYGLVAYKLMSLAFLLLLVGCFVMGIIHPIRA